MKIEILKKLIKESVRDVLREELKNLGIVSNSTEINKSKTTNTVENRTYKKQKIEYTSNPMLNEILNETSGGVPQEGSMSGLLNEGFDKIGDNVNIPVQSNSIVVPNGISPESVPDNLLNIFNRNYSEVMAAVDKKRKK
jgi:hypothetical protein